LKIRNATGLLTYAVIKPERLPGCSPVAFALSIGDYSCGAVAGFHRFPEHRVAITEAELRASKRWNFPKASGFPSEAGMPTGGAPGRSPDLRL